VTRLNPAAAAPKVWFFALVLAVAACERRAAPVYESRIEQVLAAEDARPTDAADLAPLFEGLRSWTDGNEALTRITIRSIGRLQRGAFVDSLAPFLTSEFVAFRIEAANAIAQSAQPGSDTGAVVRARQLLTGRLDATSGGERGIVARSLGRLPHESPDSAAAAAQQIARAVTGDAANACTRNVRRRAIQDSTDASLMFGALHGLYSIARRTRSLPCAASNLARGAFTYRRAAAAPLANDTTVWVRELAVLALASANEADSDVLGDAARDNDPRVRRLAMRMTRDTAAAVRRLVAGQSDTSAMVRIDAVRTLASVRRPAACEPSSRALSDANTHVRLEAVDAFAANCDQAVTRPVLDSLVRLLPADTVSGAMSWHIPARALVALARTAPTVAQPHFGHFRMHPVWQVRAALVAAARSTGDSTVVIELLTDRDANVREAAIDMLAEFGPSSKERAARAGLSDSAYQVVLAGARNAEGIQGIDVATLAAPLARLTRRGEETSRDPRRELIERIAQRGSVADTAALRPYVSDFDALIARRAAEIMTQWTGQRVDPAAKPQIHREKLAHPAGVHMRVTLSPASGGGSFLVMLGPDEARATVARVVRLARRGYYNGRTFHRVVPNFVIQGGSPDANEYVGDGPYMRDELGLQSHTRGTLGISTRGRDTGDAQLFVNLVDNFRLDHDYTVFGEIVEGMDVVDRILSGAVIQNVHVTPPEK
jgi:cyclophilin family peptidyl-prolyl cis-trans isomerase/HEAT repeat protein